MSTTSLIDDAQHQVRDMSQAMMRLSWAMTVLGAQQAANMMTPSKMVKSGANLASALDARPPEERLDVSLTRERVRETLRRFYKRRTQRRPLVIPVVMEV